MQSVYIKFVNKKYFTPFSSYQVFEIWLYAFHLHHISAPTSYRYHVGQCRSAGYEEAQALHQTTVQTLETVNVYESSSHFLSFLLLIFHACLWKIQRSKWAWTAVKEFICWKHGPALAKIVLLCDILLLPSSNSVKSSISLMSKVSLPAAAVSCG